MTQPTPMTDLAVACAEMARRAKAASRQLATVSTARKDAWLHQAAGALEAQADALVAANVRDIAAAADNGLGPAQIDRLRLTPERIQAAVAGLRDIAAQPDPIGRVLDGGVRPNGLRVQKIGVPIGVILFIYESRPNVTVDAAGLALKSGNAIILRGGKEALHSNTAICRLLQDAVRTAGLPSDCLQFVETVDRAAVGHLLRQREFIDLVIPRGGESLIERVVREAAMPVLKHYRGNCHVYVDRAADPSMATRIVVNAKCQRPGVCNAAESLLVHRDIAARFLPDGARALRERGVELRGCETTRSLVSGIGVATDEDYAAEYLDLILSVKVVDSLAEAVDHIHRFGSGHSEAIVTEDLRAAENFTRAVDAAAVLVNASTRFNDGSELGLGAEIGISTDKLHARGPCGLRELTSYKYVIVGDGHVRE